FGCVLEGQLNVWECAGDAAPLVLGEGSNITYRDAFCFLDGGRVAFAPTVQFRWAGVMPPEKISREAGRGVSEKIRLWDASGQELPGLVSGDGARGAVSSLTPGPGGKLAAAHGGNYVRVWDVMGRKELVGFTAHGTWVGNVRFNPDGSLIATATASVAEI